MSSKPARIFAFERVWVTASPDGLKVIEWRLNKSFPLPAGTIEFYVEFARAAGEWTRLNPDSPETNTCVFVDPDPRRCGYANNEFYRVVMVVAGTSYHSTPEPTLGVWNTHDWLIARDVVRKEYLRLKRYAGVLGHLLKRREHGPKCTACLDWDTEDVVNTDCAFCYGTGYIGGYYDAIPYYMDLSGSATNRDVRQPFGESDNRKHTGRSVAYPMLNSYDLWVDGDKNKRYIVRQVEDTVEIKGRPLVYTSELRELPASSTEYSVPLEQDLTDEIGVAPDSPESAGWRRDIDFIELY